MTRAPLAILFFVSGLLLSCSSWAQKKPYPYQGRTVSPEVSIFKEANFDSQVIATVPAGRTYDISHKLFNGAFYRIRIKPGVFGYVSDADIKPLFRTADNSRDPGKKNRPERKPLEKKELPFQFTTYAGLQYSFLQYQENTMGDKRQENLSFFGVNMAGPNLLIEGVFPTEINFLFHSGAPSYYQKLTGQPADGWIFLMNFLLESYYPQGKNALTFFGFGPMVKYSHITASLQDATSGKTSAYSMDDINLGAIFNAGVAFRLGKMSLRSELQYFWEKQSYLGAGLSFQFAF